VSRIADAHARAGVRLPGEDATRWDAAREAAVEHLDEKSRRSTSNFQPPTSKGDGPSSAAEIVDLPLQPSPVPSSSLLGLRDAAARPRRKSASGETIDFDLTTALRRIFLSPKSVVRSVLFCVPPGDRLSGVAWRAAELLSAQSGQRVAFVEGGSTPSPEVEPANALITRVSWHETTLERSTSPESASDGALQKPKNEQNSKVLGRRVSDLYSSFGFVIVNATAPTTDDLLPLAREVDGVIVVVHENETRRDSAKSLVMGLKNEARVLGAILFTQS